MKLLMAMEKCQTWIVSDKVNIASLVATKHHDIFHDTGCGSPREIGQFESVTMKMDRMYIVAGIEHAQTVPFALLEVQRSRNHFAEHAVGREGNAVDGPAIEAIICRVVLRKG